MVSMEDNRRYWQQKPDNRFWPPRWSHSVQLLRTRVPQIAGLVPVLGYAVLWSDQFHGALLRFNVLGEGLLSAAQRIHLLYLGSVLVLLGLALYWLFCPQQLRDHSSAQALSVSIAEGADFPEIEAAVDKVRQHVTFSSPPAEHPRGKLFGLYGQVLLQTMLLPILRENERVASVQSPEREDSPKVIYAAYYHLLDRSRPLLAFATLGVLLLGLAIFLLPSAEVLLLALRKLPFALST